MSDNDLKDILEESVNWNNAHGITGMLLYVKGNFWKSVKRKLIPADSGRFVQLLEGRKTDVMQVFEMIKADKRHTVLSVVSQSDLEKRYFQTWDMGFKSLALEEYENIEGFFELDDDFSNQHKATNNAPVNFIRSFYEMSKVKV